MDEAQERLIERLYLELYGRLYVYACRCLSCPTLAEEAVQEAFRIACQAPEKLLGSPEPRGWIVMTLKNVIRSFRREQRMMRRTLDDYFTIHAGEEAVKKPQEVAFLSGDAALLEDYSLLWGRVIDGRSHRELAQERNITIACCRKRLQRARAHLRDRLGELP